MSDEPAEGPEPIFRCPKRRKAWLEKRRKLTPPHFTSHAGFSRWIIACAINDRMNLLACLIGQPKAAAQAEAEIAAMRERLKEVK